MIGLKFQNTATKTFAIPEVWVKSIPAAWKQIREWRDTLPFETLEGAILLVDLDGEPIVSDRIPAKILFKANKNGKLEFKDLQKIREKAMARLNTKDEETEDYPDQGEEYMEKDLALSTI